MATRAEHRRATLRRLGDASVELVLERGLDAVTAEDIARRAGVSRRTLFRYVDTMEDLLFVHPVLWLDVFETAVAEVASEPAPSRLVHASQRICEHIDADPKPVRRALKAAGSHPALAATRGAINQRWVDVVTEELVEAPDDPDDRFRAHVLAAAFMGVIDASLEEWGRAGVRTPVAGFVEQGLEHLRPILHGPPRSARRAATRGPAPAPAAGGPRTAPTGG